MMNHNILSPSVAADRHLMRPKFPETEPPKHVRSFQFDEALAFAPRGQT
jgi:hypothetical protein